MFVQTFYTHRPDCRAIKYPHITKNDVKNTKCFSQRNSTVRYCKNLQHNFQCTYPVLFVNLDSHKDPYSIPPYIWEWKPNTLSLEFSLIFLGLVWHPTPELVVPEQSLTDHWLVCDRKWYPLRNTAQWTPTILPDGTNPRMSLHKS